MGARFVWNELITSDQKASGDFFCALFGWERQQVDIGPQGTYTLFRQDGQDVAGMMNPATDYSRSRPPFWSAYIQVDGIDSCVAKVEALGGAVIAPPQDIPDVGRIGMISDPGGAPVCLMTPKNDPEE